MAVHQFVHAATGARHPQQRAGHHLHPICTPGKIVDEQHALPGGEQLRCLAHRFDQFVQRLDVLERVGSLPAAEEQL
jgi:hypothetical protein